MNEHQRRNEELAKARRQFMAAVSTGQAVAVDRQGVRIEVGHKILYRPSVDLFFDVIALNPVLDPNAPPGLINVVLQVTVPVPVQANRPMANMIAFASGPESAKDSEPPVPATTGEELTPEEVETANRGPRLVLTDADKAQTDAENSADRE